MQRSVKDEISFVKNLSERRHEAVFLAMKLQYRRATELRQERLTQIDELQQKQEKLEQEAASNGYLLNGVASAIERSNRPSHTTVGVSRDGGSLEFGDC
jgi:hypothetical protein